MKFLPKKYSNGSNCRITSDKRQIQSKAFFCFSVKGEFARLVKLYFCFRDRNTFLIFTLICLYKNGKNTAFERTVKQFDFLTDIRIFEKSLRVSCNLKIFNYDFIKRITQPFLPSKVFRVRIFLAYRCQSRCMKCGNACI